MALLPGLVGGAVLGATRWGRAVGAAWAVSFALSTRRTLINRQNFVPGGDGRLVVVGSVSATPF